MTLQAGLFRGWRGRDREMIGDHQKLRYVVSLLLLLILLPGCQDLDARRSTNSTVNQQPISASQNSNSVDDLRTVFSKEPSLSYLGYRVIKEQKTVDIEGIKTEVSYALLKKGEVTVATFDGLYHPAGNTTEFGLFSFLGGEPKQLIVEQSTPRNWSHWIAKLTPDFQVIFDSRKWSLDGELILLDINHDGTFEFTKTLAIFYDFHKLPTSESPLIPILFSYDRNAGQYIPANHGFQEYALKGIEHEVKNLDRSSAQAHLAGVLHILLRYIYAGKQQDGWAYFEREYNLKDKDVVKSDVVSKLEFEPVYKFIYQKSQ